MKGGNRPCPTPPHFSENAEGHTPPRGRVVARLLLDIGAVTLGGLLERVYHVTGLRGGGLRFVWASPPCDTYSRMDTTNGSYHRDWEGAAEGAPCSLEAQLADTLLIHLFAMLS